MQSVDCFAAGLASGSEREYVMQNLANFWGVPLDRVVYYSQLHKPKLKVCLLLFRQVQVRLVACTSVLTGRSRFCRWLFKLVG